ncbi:MAG: hypothetical protein ACJ70O_01095 [Nitrososphaera sp.]
MDGDPSNNDPDNLCVLCLLCHDQTQIAGGFGRKYKPQEIKLYRDGWLKLIANTRTTIPTQEQFSSRHNEGESLDHIAEELNLLPLNDRVSQIGDKTGCLIKCLMQDKNIVSISYQTFSHGNDRNLQLEIESIISLIGRMFSPKDKYRITILYPEPSDNLEGLDQPEFLTMETSATLIHDYVMNKISFRDLWKEIKFFVKESNTYSIRTKEVRFSLVI